jgi:hypothetical protein
MPIRRYLGEGVFTPKTISEMSKAFEATVEILGIGRDEAKRRGVAKLIIRLARKTTASMPRPCAIGRSRRWEASRTGTFSPSPWSLNNRPASVVEKMLEVRASSIARARSWRLACIRSRNGVPTCA